MPDNSDSLFGNIPSGQGWDPGGGQLDLYNVDFDISSGQDWANQWDINQLFGGRDISPQVAMLIQSGMMDISQLDDYYTDPNTGQRISEVEMWGRKYGKHFDEYDWRAEGQAREKSYRDKKFKQQSKAKDMTKLTQSFGKQGFAGSGQQAITKQNLYDSAIREQNLEDVGLRKNVMGLHTDWENSMWNTFAQLAKQGALGKWGEGELSDWDYSYQTTTDGMNWNDYWAGEYSDEGDDFTLDYGGG